MSRVSALAHVEAMETMTAVPLTRFRHRRLSERPLVVVPLTMAGEAGTPVSVLVGDAKRSPKLLVVGQPRDRNQRIAFAAEFGRIVLDHINSFRVNRREIPSRSREKQSRYASAPQLIVPNPGGIRALADLGRICRFRRTTGPYPVPATVPELGMWLTFLAESAEQAGTSMLVAATDLLSEHWATGQSALEDRNLASLLAWIAPPDGRSVEQALADAENPIVCPPAGPSTSPEFDNIYLEPAIKRADAARAAGDERAAATAHAELRDLLNDQMKPTWRMMWTAISLLRGVPEAPHAAARFDGDCTSFTDYSDYQDTGTAVPQPKRDKAIAAARRLSRLERALAELESDMALDDPFVLADRRSVGEAFAGEVVEADPDRFVTTEKNSRVRRPLITVRTLDPTRLADGIGLVSPSMPKGHKAVIISTERGDDASLVTIEVTAGMGRGRTPKAETIPVPGQYLEYLPAPGWRPIPVFPDPSHTPWTHSTAEPDPETTDADAAEEWGDDT
ncbi:hypothetical protein ACFYXQ_09240 [Nocardia jiangxiensis]|uniref:Uncharacterized protein n=1 Tax=Nocardia jiangxiensis TaxID=282685 RepID=A0ABW6RVA5_9NOCA